MKTKVQIYNRRLTESGISKSDMNSENLYPIVMASMDEYLKESEKVQQGSNWDKVIKCIENAEIAIPIERFFKDGEHITKKEYGHVLIEILCEELRSLPFPNIVDIKMSESHIEEIFLEGMNAQNLINELPTPRVRLKKLKEKFSSVYELDTFDKIFADHLEWVKKDLPLTTSMGGIIHAREELDEIESDIKNGASPEQKAVEYGDVMFCELYSARNERISLDLLKKSMRDKLEINKKRTWKYNGNGSYSHVKS